MVRLFHALAVWLFVSTIWLLPYYRALFVGSFVATIWLLSYYRKAVPRGAVDTAPLSWGERFWCGFLAFFNPVLTGLILWIGWRRTLPRKARQALAIASGVFVTQILLVFTAFFLLARYVSFS
jgi:hypothetical protein